MGCDIHLHIEVKINDKWQHYGIPNIWRNYTLFEKLAGVRGDMDKAIAEPRGIPKNATTLTRYDYERWDCDAHTPSWISAKEIYEIQKFAKEQHWPKAQNSVWNSWEWEDVLGCFLFGNTFAGFTEYPIDRPPEVKDLRFIFWFDN